MSMQVTLMENWGGGFTAFTYTGSEQNGSLMESGRNICYVQGNQIWMGSNQIAYIDGNCVRPIGGPDNVLFKIAGNRVFDCAEAVGLPLFTASEECVAPLACAAVVTRGVDSLRRAVDFRRADWAYPTAVIGGALSPEDERLLKRAGCAMPGRGSRAESGFHASQEGEGRICGATGQPYGSGPDYDSAPSAPRLRERLYFPDGYKIVRVAKIINFGRPLADHCSRLVAWLTLVGGLICTVFVALAYICGNPDGAYSFEKFFLYGFALVVMMAIFGGIKNLPYIPRDWYRPSGLDETTGPKTDVIDVSSDYLWYKRQFRKLFFPVAIFLAIDLVPWTFVEGLAWWIPTAVWAVFGLWTWLRANRILKKDCGRRGPEEVSHMERVTLGRAPYWVDETQREFHLPDATDSTWV